MVEVAQVIVDVRTRQLDRPFDYEVPARLHGRLRPGHRVYVPFGRQYCQGYVLAVQPIEDANSSDKAAPLKPILTLLDELPLLTPELLALHEYLCERTICTHLEALQTMIPGAYRVRGVRRYRAVPGGARPEGLSPESLRLWQALASGRLSFEDLTRKFGRNAPLDVEQWLAAGVVEEIVDAEDEVRAKRVAVLQPLQARQALLHAAHDRISRASRQAAVLTSLAQEGTVRLRDHGLIPSDLAVQALIRDGLATLADEEVYRAPVAASLSENQPKRELTDAQEKAVAAIMAAMRGNEQTGVMLHGVTGSGKTEVYLQSIEECLDQDGGAIVLVPEIALTPQMVGRFTSRFGDQVAVLHSGLSAGERRDEWLRVRRGEARVVVGARSAVFAPVHNLRLIVVDEAHEPSYKQEESPHYDAREVAQVRARMEGAAVVLGSATPSMELLHAAEQGELNWVSMPVRVQNLPMPTVTIIDMRDELRQGNRGLLSEAMRQGLEEAVSNGRQAMLFLNRRGYAAFMLCRGCGQSIQCPNCDISLTLHRSLTDEWLACHYCDYREPVPERCASCGEPAVRPFGVGTQQVEQAVHELWPDWRVLRMDVDTTRRKGAHRDAVQQVLDRQVDVLLGTQMIAKGLDFPGVSFVGVIAADTMLAVPDFRAAERTFSLLTQVIGRAGRAEVPGRTVIQTYRPDHYAIRAAAGHDFPGFYHQEQTFRRTFDYPPYCEITVFSANHEQESYARGAAARFERELRRALKSDDAVILPASPAGVQRVKGQFRYQVVVKYSQWSLVRNSLGVSFRAVRERMRPLGGTCRLDVNALRI